MRAVNLYTYTRIQSDLVTEFENILSQRSKKKRAKDYEFNAIKTLVDLIFEKNGEIKAFDNFFVSYTIEQIGKEFDLLKIDRDNIVLNIELKSEDVGEEAVYDQLRKNFYYLKSLAPDVRLYTFVESTKELFRYTKQGIQQVPLDNLIEIMVSFEESLEENIEDLFQTNNYLISPLNNVNKFLMDEYFLTNDQKSIKEQILNFIFKSPKPNIIGITGDAGTGKTLILYDIVKNIAGYGEKCCLIHSGILCKGHEDLNNQWKNVDIISAKNLNGDGVNRLQNYQYFFVDESQRIYVSAFKKIIDEVSLKNKTVIFSYDYEQSLSKSEKRCNIPNKLNQIDGFIEYKLLGKIRTSKEISSFTRNMMNLNRPARGYMDYSNIEILFANDVTEALGLIEYYKEKGYIFISYTQSLFVSNTIDKYPRDYNTHHVIGQEYDKVMIVMDNNFRYDEDGRIQGRRHPNPDYLFYKLLYQAISRARENLCILVVENYQLFSDILSIKFDMLSRYQYKENHTNATLSVKKMNRYTKRIKDSLKAVKENDAITISETVDMINDELVGAELKKKVVRNGLKLLIILQENLENEETYKSISNYCEYVQAVTGITDRNFKL